MDQNERIDRLIESLTFDSETWITETYLCQLMKNIDDCLNLSDDDLFFMFFYTDKTYRQQCFQTTIQETVNQLWNVWTKNGYIYKDYELQFLRNVYQLYIKFMSINLNVLNEDEEKMDKGYFDGLERLLLIPTNFQTLQTILSSINTFLVSSSISSGLVELTIWLDIYTVFNHRYLKHDHLKEQIDLIQLCILDEKYKKYLSLYYHNGEIDIIQKFYIGTCSLFCAFLYNVYSAQEKHRWINLIESLLFYLQRFVVESTQCIEKWTDDLLYCIVGVLTLNTNYYCLKREDRINPSLHPRLFPRYEQFFQILLNILKHKQFHRQILSTWTNNETRLIDTIIKYFLLVSTDFIDIKYLLRSRDGSNIIIQFLDTEYTEINRNTSYLLAILCTDNDIRKLNIDKKLISIYLKSIENLTLSSSNSHRIKKDQNKLPMIFNCFLLLSKNTSIQKAVEYLNGIQILVQIPNDHTHTYDIIPEILWTLSFHPFIQKQVKNDPFLLTSIRKIPTSIFCDKKLTENILWTLGDHVGLANLEHEINNRNNPLENMATYKFILNYSIHDQKIGENIFNHLYLYDFPTFSNLSISLLQSKALDSIKKIIICLSEYYEQDNLCRATLQYSSKQQFHIIPILLQKSYKPQSWLNEIVNKIPIIDFTELSFIDAFHLLINTLQYSSQQNLKISSNKISTDDIDQSENISQDFFFTICKNNKIDKLKEYLNKMTIKQINHIDSDGNTALHIATCYNNKEIIQLLLDSEILRSIRNPITNLTACEMARTFEIRQLFRRSNDQDLFVTNSSYELIEWTFHYSEPTLQRSQFRRQLLNPFKIDKNNVQSILDKNQLSAIFRGIIENFRENFLIQLPSDEMSSRHKLFIEWFFNEAIEQANSFYIIKAYTSTTNFYRVLNKTLAKFALEYFNGILKQSTDYKIVTSIVDLISLLMHDPDLEKYDFSGKTYRGMLVQEEDLCKYVVGSKLMNISFVSTSKNRDVAEIYAGGSESLLSGQIAALCIYKIKNVGTALDIEQISEISDESEVLLLPFSAFQIQCIRRLDTTVNNVILIELELEECDEHLEQESKKEKRRQLLSSLLHQ